MLRGINAKNINSEDGNKAKSFIESKLSACEFIIVKTYWRDKYSRYLADIFYNKDENDFLTALDKSTLLNQQLLDKKLAVKY